MAKTLLRHAKGIVAYDKAQLIPGRAAGAEAMVFGPLRVEPREVGCGHDLHGQLAAIHRQGHRTHGNFARRVYRIRANSIAPNL